MKVTRGTQDGVAVLRLDGEFDTFETDVVRDGFEGCVQQGHRAVVLDLGGMTFANSTTIAYFITAQKRAEALGGGVVLARPREAIRKTMTTLGLDKVFRFADSVDSAIATLKPR
jgi:anti-anti-sigma factor